MTYTDFQNIVNNKFGRYQERLLMSIAEAPERFISDYLFASLESKLNQTILTSQEILAGDVLEQLYRKELEERGAEYLSDSALGNALKCDHLFYYHGALVLIEQKKRDDHDSTKKRGQVENFEKKVNLIKQLHPESQFVPIMWFLDEQFTKNQTFYKEQVGQALVYGNEICNILDNIYPEGNHNQMINEVKQHILSYQQTMAHIDLNFENITIDWSSFTCGQILVLLQSQQILKIISPNKKIFDNVPSIIQNRRNDNNKKLLLQLLEARNDL